MRLEQPFVITSRLMAGLCGNGGEISIGYAKRDSDGRTAYDVWIDIPAGEFHITDLRSGCQGGSLQEGMASLLSFLTAAAESLAYQERTGHQGENTDLFPLPVVEWARQQSDELTGLQMEIEETPGLIAE